MENFLEMASEKILNKEYDEAIELCDKQIELGEDLANAYYQKARAFYKLYIIDKDLEYLQAALSLINESITLNDNDDEFFSLSGDINMDFGRNKRAEFDYSQAIELSPTAYNYYSRGLLYSKEERPELAIKDFKKAHELEPEDIDYLKELADSLSELDQFEQAIFYLDKALEIEEDSFTYFLRGLACGELRKYKEAIENMKKAIELEAGDKVVSAYYASLANLYTKLPKEKTEREIEKGNSLHYYEEFQLYDYDKNISYKNYDIAINYMKKAIETDSNYENYYWLLAKIYNDIDNYGEEIKIYNKLEEMCPENSEVYFRRGKSYYRSNNFEKAISDLTQTIEIQPDNFSAYYYRGRARKKLDDDLLAIGDICFAAKNDDCNAIDYLNDNYEKREIKSMLATTEKYQEIYQKEEELKNEQNKILEELYKKGKEIFEQQEYDELLQLCENAISEYEIENEKIYNLKAAAEIMLEMYNEAQNDCEKALLLNPNFKQARINLNLIREMKNQK